MRNNTKSDNAYKTIGEITKELGLIDRRTGHLQTHTLRYWETQFKQIKPSIKAGNRRYYSKKDVQILKNIKNKSIKNKVDHKTTRRIWKSMIWSYVDFQKRNFKKK